MEDFLAACRGGNVESLVFHLSSIKDERILRKGLLVAVEAQQVAVIASLLQHGVPIDISSFMGAARVESQEIWTCFIDHGLDINSVEYGSSPLFLSTDKPLLVKWLLEHGADPNLKMQNMRGSSYQVSALGSALASNNLDSMKVLVAHGAVLESRLFDKCVAPFLNDKIGVETLKWLLDAGLDPNVVVERGNGTPLQLAVRRGMLDKARALLQAGSSIRVHNKDGETPLEEAQKVGNKEMVELLASYSR